MANYEKTGNCCNKLIIDFLEKSSNTVYALQYSVLEILPGSSTANDAVAKENLWKEKLGSKINGYNDN